METESTNKTPILNIAWTRYAHLDATAIRRTRAFYQIRRLILWLGVVATFFAILTTTFFSDSQGLLGVIVKIFFVATPVVASIIAAFATRFYSNGSWLVFRAGAEEIKKEIYLYRTTNQKNRNRRGILEKRLAEIQRQMFRSLGGEFSFEPYDGPIPPGYKPETPGGDSGFNDLMGDEYFQYRLEHQLVWHNSRINRYKGERRRLTIYILTSGGLGAVFAAWGGGLSILVAFTASLTAALIGWQELKNLDSTIRNYSKVVMEMTILYDHWHNLEQEERTDKEFHRMVQECEKILWDQNAEYIRSMQEVLKDADLEEQASLVEGAIDKAVESANRTQQALRDAALEATGEALQSAENKVVEEFKETLGKLAEEASSELVQQELEAMSNAVTEAVQTAAARASTFTSSLAQIADEFAHVEIGRDTSKEELNAILARYPKTGDIKG